jgi:hypothetical protein
MTALNYDREGYVFNYFDGEKAVTADPSLIFDKLLNDPDIDFIGEWQDMNQIKDPDQRRDCYSNLVEVIDRAFDVKPLGKDGTGLTLAERWILAEEFITWINDVKKKLSVFPTRWQSSVEESSEQIHIQKPDLDSDSITEESKAEEPSPSA